MTDTFYLPWTADNDRGARNLQGPPLMAHEGQLPLILSSNGMFFSPTSPLPLPPHVSSISFPESIGTEIEKKCQSIFPLKDVFIRKVKVLKKPKFDLTKLMEMHGDTAGEDTGAALDKLAAETTVKALKGAGGRL